MYIHSNINNSINRLINRDVSRGILMNSQITKKIVSLLGKEKVITSSELAKHLGISWNTAEKYLLELVIENKIVKIKKQGVNLWVIK